MKLIIAEKPSVAAAYAAALGAKNKKDGYLEGNGCLVTWCIGHLVSLAEAGAYEERYKKWNYEDLPILPEVWQHVVSPGKEKQFSIVKSLMERPDVTELVNGCDAGREGELIFRLVYQQAGCKKPFSRLWLSSMEENAIREGFAHLKPSTEYDALYNAALCRERADWMVGINASRLFSCLYGQPLAVGRVMTPVLAMTVVREAAIAAFTPEKFYTVDLELTSGCTASSRRIPEKSVAENLLKACRKEMVATIQRITRKEKSENPPPLYDLTTLQRDANRLLGYSAQQTLDYVQSLYEKKLTTYPRTDSCYITDDDEEMLEELTEALERFFDITPEDVDEAVPRTRRTVNREKVTDHHAILPTRSMLQADLEALPKGEQNVLKLIIARTLMAVSKPFRYLETLLTTECAGEEFTAKGKEVLEEGWKAVERKVLADILNRKQELTALPNAAENECGILNAELKEGQTVGLNGETYSLADARSLEKALAEKEIKLNTNASLIDPIWKERPAIPEAPMFEMPIELSGKSTEDKLIDINKMLHKAGADCTILSALDEVAWTFNIRGTDVAYNPVVISYAFVSEKESVLFVNPKKIPAEIAEHLKKEGVTLADYGMLATFLSRLPERTRVFIDSKRTNVAIYNALPKSSILIEGTSPANHLKSIKNETEIKGFRNAVLKDGIAMTKFYFWLEKMLKAGEKVTELSAAAKLTALRSEQPQYVMDSFASISSYGPHGAVVHYSPTPETDTELKTDSLYLLDSGAQYLDGTTDITRTIALCDEPSEQMKKDFTRALKGTIGIAKCKFPAGIRGCLIDAFARKALWDAGINYLHGTCHGIGHCLNVHEGPQSIRMEENPVILEPGMVMSDEPAIYRPGEYGIRTENMILIHEDSETEFGKFLGFETLTLCYIDTKLVIPSMLSVREHAWLNKYHQMVYDLVSPHLTEEEKAWLKEKTAEI